MTAEIIKAGVFSLQVCVPEDWTDEQVIALGEEGQPCGTECGWTVRKEDDQVKGYRERVPCDEREGHVHLVLDA